jgi:hypothetical protein
MTDDERNLIIAISIVIGVFIAINFGAMAMQQAQADTYQKCLETVANRPNLNVTAAFCDKWLP